MKHVAARERVHPKALNRLWASRLAAGRAMEAMSWPRYHAMMKGYVRGFFHALRRPAPAWVLVPTDRSFAVVVTAMNEGRTLGAVLAQISRLPADELIVVVNGSVDASFRRARSVPGAIVVNEPQPLGHDVGRALGAKLARADTVLFLDGDFAVSAEQLVPFLHGIGSGLDVALNDIGPYLGPFYRQDAVTGWKQFLNTALGRPDLRAASLTAVPHAVSRKAIDTLGPQSFMVPPKAQARALLSGLAVGTAGSVNVIRANKRRPANRGMNNRMAQLIVGDHIEALHMASALAGARLRYDDTIRRRSMAGEVPQ